MHHSHDGHDHHSHNHTGRGSRLLVVILLNIIITVSEYIGGILSGSLALVSDAGHNLSDVLSLMLGYAGEKVSSRRASTRYTFGMKRFEVVVALVNSLILVAMAVFILYEAIERFRNPVPVKVSVMLPVACIGLAGNVLSMLFLFQWRDSTLNLKAAFLHLLYDAVSSVAVISAAVILYYTGFLLADLVISVIIVAMIFWSSTGILTQSMRIFLQGAPAHIDVDMVREELKRIQGVEDVHGLHIWSVSSTEVFLSCHIYLGEHSSGTDTSRVISMVNTLLAEEFGIEHTTIQVETSLLCNPGNDCCR